MKFRNIIWDVDGTLFDTYPGITLAIKAALNDLGKDAPLEWISQLAKQSLNHCADVLTDKFQLESDAFEQALEKHFNLITIEESPPFAGVIELCQYICSIGGKNVIITHRGRKGTMDLLEGYDLEDYFSGVITSDDGFPRKPDPAAFTAALERFQLPLDETLTIGDREIDIQAGQAAGLFSCFFGAGAEAVGADLVISSFEEFHAYLLKSV